MTRWTKIVALLFLGTMIAFGIGYTVGTIESMWHIVAWGFASTMIQVLFVREVALGITGWRLAAGGLISFATAFGFFLIAGTKWIFIAPFALVVTVWAMVIGALMATKATENSGH